MPAAWLRISDFCSWVRSSLGMCRLASAPKPVEIPYAGTSLEARSSMWARTLATVVQGFGGDGHLGVVAGDGDDVFGGDSAGAEGDCQGCLRCDGH